MVIYFITLPPIFPSLALVHRALLLVTQSRIKLRPPCATTFSVNKTVSRANAIEDIPHGIEMTVRCLRVAGVPRYLEGTHHEVTALVLRRCSVGIDGLGIMSSWVCRSPDLLRYVEDYKLPTAHWIVCGWRRPKLCPAWMIRDREAHPPVRLSHLRVSILLPDSTMRGGGIKKMPTGSSASPKSPEGVPGLFVTGPSP